MAQGDAVLQISFENLDRLKMKLRPAQFLKPLDEFWSGYARSFAVKARERAPLDTGRLRNSIREFSYGGRTGVMTDVRSPKGFPYPWYLDVSDRTHYRMGQRGGRRGGRGSRIGAPTRDWWSGVAELVVPRMDQLMDRFRKRIEDQWSSR